MKIDKIDLVQLTNLSKALKRAKFDNLTSEEILVLAQVFTWVGSLILKFEKDLDETPPIITGVVKEIVTESKPKRKRKKKTEGKK